MVGIAELIETSYPTYVIDDESDVRAAIAFQLSTAGRGVVTFASGAEFLDACSHLARGCLLVDVRMPGPDGIALLRELRTRGVDWPVIVMTGHGEVQLAVQAIRGGAFDLLEKPFDDAVLMSCLATAARMLDARSTTADPI